MVFDKNLKLKRVINIDVRKLISFGKGSYIVSMPKSWIEKNKLKKGDLISVDDEGVELILKAGNEEKKQDSLEISIDAKGKANELLKTEIVSSYLNGYDTISIQFDANSSEVPKIKDILRNLSGLEIMEQTSTRLVAKNLININEISINHIIRRMDIIARAMMQDAALCSRGQCTYDNIHDRDSDVNRLYYLGYRVIKNALKNPRVAKAIGQEPWQLHIDSFILKRLERIADKQKRIARFLHSAELDRETLNELDRIYTDIIESYNDVMKSYYNRDRELAFRIEISNKTRAESCNRFLEKYMQTHAKAKSKTANDELVSVARIVENLKATTVEIRDLARNVLCYE